ncbi:MAG: hypothetical protein JXX28_19265 [Deltaproteobacteria bacterium]|nr:hypothetical protein [Deltaproteobacteria bacterium]
MLAIALVFSSLSAAGGLPEPSGPEAAPPPHPRAALRALGETSPNLAAARRARRLSAGTLAAEVLLLPTMAGAVDTWMVREDQPWYSEVGGALFFVDVAALAALPIAAGITTHHALRGEGGSTASWAIGLAPIGLLGATVAAAALDAPTPAVGLAISAALSPAVGATLNLTRLRRRLPPLTVAPLLWEDQPGLALAGRW